jgi:hypothetical protein
MISNTAEHIPEITVVDLDCRGAEHEIYNAATIHAIRIANPNTAIRIIARRTHVAHLQPLLTTSIKLLQPLVVDEVTYEYNQRLSLRDCLDVLNKSAKKGRPCRMRFHKRCFVFLSCSPISFMAIKIFAFRNPGIDVIVMFHGILERLELQPQGDSSLTDSLFRLFFRWRTSRNVTYGILGGSIDAALRVNSPGLRIPCTVIDIPYIFDMPESNRPFTGNQVSFGHLGYAHAAKGFNMFLKLAAECRNFRKSGQAQFLVVGGTDKLDPDINGSSDVSYASNEWPVPRVQYARLLVEITYAVFVYPSNSYHLRASGALFDAICAIKPIIALRNPYFEYVFGLVGDIGYLCDSMSELRAVCESVVVDFPRERYAAQQRCLVDAQRRFSAAYVARQWKESYFDKLGKTKI